MERINNKMKPVLFISIIFLIGLISAAGVATPYWEDNPLKLAPGESTTITLYLQNMAGDEDMTIEAAIEEDPEGIATIINGPEYSVPLGSEEVPVEIKIEIPETKDIGSNYTVSVSFQQVSSGEGGMLHVAGAFTSDIPIEIVASEESALYGTSSFDLVYLFWGILAIVGISVLLILSIMIKKKRNSKNN